MCGPGGLLTSNARGQVGGASSSRMSAAWPDRRREDAMSNDSTPERERCAEFIDRAKRAHEMLVDLLEFLQVAPTADGKVLPLVDEAYNWINRTRSWLEWSRLDWSPGAPPNRNVTIVCHFLEYVETELQNVEPDQQVGDRLIAEVSKTHSVMSRLADADPDERSILRAIDAARERLGDGDPSPTEPVVASQSEATPSEEPVVRSDTREAEVLIVLFENEAFSEAKRMTTDDIAEKANPHTGSENYRTPVGNLGHLKMVHTRRGRGGGVWLTSQGKRNAELLMASG